MRYVVLPLFVMVVVVLSGCEGIQIPQKWLHIIDRMSPELEEKQLYVGDPVFIRIFKEEKELELWMQPAGQAEYVLVKTYPICHWSGDIGPKYSEGDRQSPEGFYATDLKKLKEDSLYHLAFNIGFPNDYDRAHGRTGSFIMVHGDCVSEGCYAMTDPQIEEIYVLVEQALRHGQYEVPVHVFPFRMTEARMRGAFASRHYHFWRNLKEGYDFFETRHTPPMWIVRNKEYEFY